MKKRNWLLILMIIVCIAGYFGYCFMDAMRTDTEAPEIKMDTQIPEVSVQDPRTALLQGITARDDRDGDVTDLLVVESVNLLDNTGKLMVSYAAFDHAGNVSKAQREARYTDYESPKFVMSSPLLFSYGSTFDILNTVGAWDAIDGDIQHRIRATALDEQSISTMGIHEVKFQVTNSLGDTVSQVFPVEVYDPEMYDAKLNLKSYLIYLPVGASFSSNSYLKSFVLGGEETSLENGLPKDYTMKVKGGVQTQTPGTYTVELRVTYTERHETNSEYDRSFTGYSKLIVVVEG